MYCVAGSGSFFTAVVGDEVCRRNRPIGPDPLAVGLSRRFVPLGDGGRRTLIGRSPDLPSPMSAEIGWDLPAGAYRAT